MSFYANASGRSSHQLRVDKEQIGPLNGPEQASTCSNGSALTCRSSAFTGQRGLAVMVHAEEVTATQADSGRTAHLTRMYADRGSSAQFRQVPEIHPFVDDPI